MERSRADVPRRVHSRDDPRHPARKRHEHFAAPPKSKRALGAELEQARAVFRKDLQLRWFEHDKMVVVVVSMNAAALGMDGGHSRAGRGQGRLSFLSRDARGSPWSAACLKTRGQPAERRARATHVDSPGSSLSSHTLANASSLKSVDPTAFSVAPHPTAKRRAHTSLRLIYS